MQLAFLLMICISCSNNPNAKGDKQSKTKEQPGIALHEEVMAAHDTLMKFWPELQHMQLNISQAITDSLWTAKKDSLLQVSTELKRAYLFMADWMEDYEEPADTNDWLQYYTEQKKIVDSMDKVMRKAYTRGLEWTEKLENRRKED